MISGGWNTAFSKNTGDSLKDRISKRVSNPYILNPATPNPTTPPQTRKLSTPNPINSKP